MQPVTSCWKQVNYQTVSYTHPAQKTSQELNELKIKYETFNNMKELSDETELYLEMLEEDDSVQEELEETLEKLDKIMTSYEMTLLLSEPYDHNNAILEIHPGSGGTEAQDWAEMLLLSLIHI